MRILIVGGGGREHALAWKIAQSPRCTQLYCTPGNPGIARVAQCLAIPALAPDFAELSQWCRDKSIDLAVIGPERPLAEGIVDALSAAGIRCFGPTRSGARLESSKRFAKELMAAARIPTGAARFFTELDPALQFLDTLKPPYVVKASGLAEGKGVTVAQTREEAERALRSCLEDRVFGDSGAEVLIEEFLVGEEASLLAFTDGKTIRPMASAQDHKPVGEGDTGPNTGGMGAYSPAPVLTPEMYDRAVREVLEPCLAQLRAQGIDYRGIIYAGLMITERGPSVVEFNCRFGDPEVQALVPRLDSDIVDLMMACVEGRLDQCEMSWSDDSAICVVAASGGYPGPYEKGIPIEGLDDAEAKGAVVFHAGTARDDQSRIVYRRRPRTGRHHPRRHPPAGPRRSLRSGAIHPLRRHALPHRHRRQSLARLTVRFRTQLICPPRFAHPPALRGDSTPISETYPSQ